MPRKEISLESLQSLKCAKALFSLCLLMAVATWLLNRSISENKSLHQAKRAHYERAKERLGKFKALQSKNTSLFEDLTWCSISSFQSYVEIYHSLDNGEGGMYSLSEYAPRELSDYVLRDAVHSFASNAAMIFAQNPVPQDRFERLKIAVTNSFCTTNVQKLANAFVFSGDRFFPKLDTHTLWRMSTIDGPEEWDGLARWLVFSEWPPISKIESDSPGRTISYFDRFPGEWNLSDEKWHDYYQLLAVGSSQSETVLMASWSKAHENAMSASSTSSVVHVPGTELTLNVADLLMLSGPILVFCQCLFLIFKRREMRETATLPASDRPFIFPQFSSPNDPCSAPIPTAFEECAQRVIWLLFLVLPTIILGFGVLTRFDIVTAGETSRNLPWLQSLLEERRSDFASNALDLVNLACFGISFWILLEITCLKIQSNIRPMLAAKFGLIAIIVLLVLNVVLRWDRTFFRQDFLTQAFIMLGFLLLQFCCFIASLRRRSVTGALLVTISLLVVLRLAR